VTVAHDKSNQVGAKLKAQADAYRDGSDQPVGEFLATMGAYSALVAGMSAFVASRGKPLPARLSWSDLGLAALATHKVSRLMAKDTVTSPLRAPFMRFKGPSAPAELSEEVRGEGAKRAVGELISCPFCLDQWVATVAVFGLVVAPRVTRLAAGVFAVVAGADMLQFAYAKLQESA
jgi:hypothetical protein